MKRVDVNWSSLHHRAAAVGERIENTVSKNPDGEIAIYGVPRGGIHAAQAVVAAAQRRVSGNDRCPFFLVEDPAVASVFVDDVVDSGKTRSKFAEEHPTTKFFALVDKPKENRMGMWVSFPWERMCNERGGVEENVVRLLQFIGEDPQREGLKETPGRVVKSYRELFSGYGKDPADVVKVFEDGACDEMVVLKDVPFYSTCEHHMLPFHGVASIAYIPDKRVLGVSKMARILEIYSRRLQIQERLTEQVTECLEAQLKPKGAACLIEAVHLCMACRGVEKQGSAMVTSSLTGAFRQAEVRSEFFSLVKA